MNYSFKPGQKVICIDPGLFSLIANRVYTINEIIYIGRRELVSLVEIPGSALHSGYYSSRFRLTTNNKGRLYKYSSK